MIIRIMRMASDDLHFRLETWIVLDENDLCFFIQNDEWSSNDLYL